MLGGLLFCCHSDRAMGLFVVFSYLPLCFHQLDSSVLSITPQTDITQRILKVKVQGIVGENWLGTSVCVKGSCDVWMSDMKSRDSEVMLPLSAPGTFSDAVSLWGDHPSSGPLPHPIPAQHQLATLMPVEKESDASQRL